MIQRIYKFIWSGCRRLRSFFRNNYIISCISGNYPPPNLRVLGDITLQVQNLKIGKNVTIYPGAYLWGNNIEIGDNVNIGIGTIIYSKKRVHIGTNTIIAGQCYIIDSNHTTNLGLPIQRQPMDAAPDGIFIGDDVWIGAQCSILKGAKINNGAVIGAQSLINKEIPENAIAFGTPASVKSYRN